jgi:hypothetical protein
MWFVSLLANGPFAIVLLLNGAMSWAQDESSQFSSTSDPLVAPNLYDSVKCCKKLSAPTENWCYHTMVSTKTGGIVLAPGCQFLCSILTWARFITSA